MQRQAAAILACALLGLVAFIATLRTYSSPLLYLHYLGLAILLSSIAALIYNRVRRRWVLLAALPTIAAAMFAWWYFDYSYREWDHLDRGITYHYQDWTKRGHAFPYYRRMTWTDDIGGEQYTITRLTRYGKKHGLQTHNMKNPKYSEGLAAFGYEKDELGYFQHQWFWYGEEITEGEWMLRNK